MAPEPCKHVWAVEYTITMTRNVAGDTTVTQTVKVTYAQDWPAYNAAQANEKRLFLELLADLCRTVEEPPQGRGRKRLPRRDRIFASCCKVYSTVSGRRFMTDMRDAADRGYISKPVSYNSIYDYMGDESLRPVLLDLITRSSLPLKAIETDFAIDATEFSSTRFDRWYDHKWGKEKKQHIWVKLHAMVGVRTNVITAVEVTPQYGADAPELPGLVQRTSQHFDIDKVCADKAYLSHRNQQAIEAAGAHPLIPFKIDSKPNPDQPLWTRLYHLYHLQRDDFVRFYHLRSNVESTFMSVKAKFGDSVRSKTPVAMQHEVLLKCLAANMTYLIHSMYELGVRPEWS